MNQQQQNQQQNQPLQQQQQQQAPAVSAIRAPVDMPAAYIDAPAVIQNTWDAVNDDTLPDSYFTRMVLSARMSDADEKEAVIWVNAAHVPNVVPVYITTAPPPIASLPVLAADGNVEIFETSHRIWKKRALIALIRRRAPLIFEALHNITVPHMINIWMMHNRRSKVMESAELVVKEAERKKVLQLKLIQGLPSGLICRTSAVSAAKFVQEIRDFVEMYDIDTAILYIYLKNPTRLTPIVYNAWISTDNQVHTHSFAGLLRWIYQTYVGERMLMNLKDNLYVFKQGNMRLKLFIDKVVEKLHRFRREFTLATIYLQTLTVTDVVEADLYIHLRENTFNPTDLTQIITLHAVTSYTTLVTAALSVARVYQPLAKKGMMIRNCLQTDNKEELNRNASQFQPTPFKRRRMTDEDNARTKGKSKRKSKAKAKPETFVMRREQGSTAVTKSTAVKEFSTQKFSGSRRTPKKFGRKCYNCGKLGHIAKNCRSPKKKRKFQKPRRGKTRRTTSSRPKNLTCFNCGVFGHTVPDCPMTIDRARIRKASLNFRAGKQMMMIEAPKRSPENIETTNSRLKEIFQETAEIGMIEHSNLVLDTDGKTFKRLEELKFRDYGPLDRTITMIIAPVGIQTVYFDGGSTIDIIDEKIAQSVMHLKQKCQSFGVSTAGGRILCNSFIPLAVTVKDQKYMIKWYLLQGAILPHRWILSRETLEKLGFTDIFMELDQLNQDTEFTNHKHVIIGYEGDDGPWLQKSYPLKNQNTSTSITNRNILHKGNHYHSKLNSDAQVLIQTDNRDSFGPKYDTNFNGTITEERVKLGETDINGEFYEMYMTCYRSNTCDDRKEFLETIRDDHKELFVINKENTKFVDEDDHIEIEIIPDSQAVKPDPDSGRYKCGDIRRQFMELLQKMPHAKTRTDIGCLTLEFEITLKKDAKPCYTAQYPSAYKWTNEIKAQCMELLIAGFIKRSKSQYQSAILFVAKPDGTWRMVFDYRKLNDITIADNYNLPNMNDLFTKFRGNRFFSSLDMRSGYYHIPIAERDQHKTAFITPWGLFEWTRMAFGFKNAPAHFQRCMDSIFQSYPFVLVYLDDIFVMSPTAELHIQHLNIVIDLLIENNMKTRLSKCSFFAVELKYLGHIISREGFHPNERYIAKVLRMRKPTTKKEVERYLGMVNWLIKFIPNLAQGLSPINRLKGKEILFRWTAECDHAFDIVQNLVSNTKFLFHPDFNRKFYIQTDASNNCIGAMLFQHGDDNKVKPIEFMSRKLHGNELNWHSNEKECFAVLQAVKKWYKFLCANPFVILTDHKNLEVLLGSIEKITSGRVHRWATFLQSECRFTVRHVKGVDNIPADYLSRDILHDTPIMAMKREREEFLYGLLGGAGNGNGTGDDRITYAHGRRARRRALRAQRPPVAPEIQNMRDRAEEQDEELREAARARIAANVAAAGIAHRARREQQHRASLARSRQTLDRMTRYPNIHRRERFRNRSENINVQQQPVRRQHMQDSDFDVENVLSEDNEEEEFIPRNMYADVDDDDNIPNISSSSEEEANVEVQPNLEHEQIYRQQRNSTAEEDEKRSSFSSVEMNVQPQQNIQESEPANEEVDEAKSYKDFERQLRTEIRVAHEKMMEESSSDDHSHDNGDPSDDYDDTHHLNRKSRKRKPTIEELNELLDSDSVSWEGENDRSRPLLMEDPELLSFLDHTLWDQELTPILMMNYQQADQFLGKLRQALEGYEGARLSLNKTWRRRISDGTVFLNDDGILMIYDHKILVPDKLKFRILDYFHSSNYFAHQGRDRMTNHIRGRFWWQYLQRDISRHLKNCKGCGVVKGSQHHHQTLMQLFPSRYPFHMVACDLVEMPHAKDGYKHLFTMIDRFSRFALAIPLADSKAETVVDTILQHWVYKYGTPVHLLTDNGPQFTAHVFKQFVNRFSIKHKCITPYHPQTNGMLERLHRYIKQRIVLAAVDQLIDLLSGETWYGLIHPIIFAYNSTVNRMTGYSPFELVFNRSPRFPIDLSLNLKVNDIQCHGSIDSYIEALSSHQRAIFLNANIKQDKYDQRRKKHYDKGRKKTELEVGEHVTVYNVAAKGKKLKFVPKWSGIWIITERYNSNAIKIEEISSGKEKRINVSLVKRIHWHMDQTI